MGIAFAFSIFLGYCANLQFVLLLPPMPIGKLFAKKAAAAAASGGGVAATGPKRPRFFSPQDIFELKNTLHTATKQLNEAEWKKSFAQADVKGKGALSFAEFRF